MNRSERAWLAALAGLIAAPVVAGAAVLLPTTTLIDDRMPSFHFQPTEVYTVKPGDTLWNLSDRLGVPVAQLIADNQIVNPDMLHVGQKLIYHPPGWRDPVRSLLGYEVRRTQDPAPQTLTSRSGDPLQFLPQGTRVIYCTLTAYTAGYESTGKLPGDPLYGVTSTGKHVVEGETVAVDPRVIPYGTRVFIPGVGYRIAEDTGGAIVGNHIDIYYDDVRVARKFGVKYHVPVYILPSDSSNA
ncbi:3D domain-containing protein [Alicyclobacillus sp.]|uniref:3D domain-containing protein n=1 Tax=Alicyclobacillus sp. TaxID=61169 RepID=UPI0025BA2349|nr:3D domain-containing protein [Alicyclobacillus sp.]MCL6515475.1 LysM peptidoglycan-binding domain-containing protein [Alicyclobacillus sp.]